MLELTMDMTVFMLRLRAKRLLKMPDYLEREYPRATVVYKSIRPTTYHLSLTHIGTSLW
jgi:hypothetical protein